MYIDRNLIKSLLHKTFSNKKRCLVYTQYFGVPTNIDTFNLNTNFDTPTTTQSAECWIQPERHK